MKTVKGGSSDREYVSETVASGKSAAGSCHTLFFVLPGRSGVRLGLAASPFTEAKLYPSTDWEETFPCAVSLTQQSH